VNTANQIQSLMNSAAANGGAIAEISGHKVRCISVPVGNTTKLSYRFDLDGKRAAFAKVCAAVGYTTAHSA
jgi:hypothetical protein